MESGFLAELLGAGDWAARGMSNDWINKIRQMSCFTRHLPA
jgi:hypothetical protein